MSMVCFPFKREKVETILRNVSIAISHSYVSFVLLVAAKENDCYKEVVEGLQKKWPFLDTVDVIVQRRLGSLREGKGDGMNTALQYFLSAHENPKRNLSEPLRRLHFYDADIESFDTSWITKAEEGMNMGYDVVRHYFPRSSTDAQVTWQVTKVGFALLWPHSVLPWIQQPLGGELCFSRRVVEHLACDERVLAQSDWGIDTLYTFVCAQQQFSLLETYMPEGKMHALYGGLRDLQTMLCECFAAVQSLRLEPMLVGSGRHDIEPSCAVPTRVTRTIGYGVEKSLKLLRENWTSGQFQLLEKFDNGVKLGMARAAEWPEYQFMDEDAWAQAYDVCLEHFEKHDSDWRELLFKMWVARVLNYTMKHVLRGYDCAIEANTRMVQKVLRESLIGAPMDTSRDSISKMPFPTGLHHHESEIGIKRATSPCVSGSSL